jgi:hypothetical protein
MGSRGYLILPTENLSSASFYNIWTGNWTVKVIHEKVGGIRLKKPLNVDQLGAELSWGAVVVKITYLAETSVLYENPREKAQRQAWLLEQTGKNNPIPKIWVFC